MSEDNNIKKYSAADIEKYWKGQLSNSEMYALEKAAMDDSFLADALEGYKNSSAPVDEIEILKDKLAERISSSAKTVSINTKKNYWLKVAAAIVVIGGLGFLAQQVFLSKKDNSIAKTENLTPANSEKEKPAEQVKADTITNLINSDKQVDKKIKNEVATVHDGRSAEIKSAVTDSVILKLSEIKPDAEKLNEVVVIASPRQPESNKEVNKSINDLSKAKKDNDVVSANSKLEEVSIQKQQAAGAMSNKSSGYFNLNNKFIYKVVDDQNNPVPFANVSNTKDDVGTYTDIKGMFNLISSDSVLNVQIKSLGYNSSNYRLVPANTPGNLVLQEDLKARTEILANNRKVVSSRRREETAVLEEPEVGWESYNTYVLNNINIPDDIAMNKPNSEVELSFQVDKNGTPVNIKVTKTSDCKICDDAAVRVLKEGPKWSRKGKNSKTIVSIAVDK